MHIAKSEAVVAAIPPEATQDCCRHTEQKLLLLLNHNSGESSGPRQHSLPKHIAKRLLFNAAEATIMMALMTIITSVISALQEHWHYGRWFWALLWKSAAATGRSLWCRVMQTHLHARHIQACGGARPMRKLDCVIWPRCRERMQSLRRSAIYSL